MLTGKIALVTGAGRGIGREIALTLAKNGATVIVNYNGSKASADEVVAEIEKNGGSAEAMQCNVSDFAASEEFVKQVLVKYKKVDILVNNAGVTRDNLIMRMSEEDYDAVLDTNLKGAFNMIRHLSRSFIKQRGGKIINISSVWGTVGASCEVAYSATKGAVIALTKALAQELGPSHIRVNCVSPGVILTDMCASVGDETLRDLAEQTPLGKNGSPDEIAEALLYLARANFVTGQNLPVNGGFVV